MRGKVKWFAENKGYGFIAPEDGTQDVFVHHSGIKMEGFKTLSAGDYVEFETAPTDRGVKAVEVVKIKAPEEDGK